MNSIKLTAFKNTLVAVAGMVGGAVVTVLFLRFLVDLMKAYDVDPALGLGIVIVTVFAGLAMRLLYKIEVARLEAIDRLNNKVG